MCNYQNKDNDNEKGTKTKTGNRIYSEKHIWTQESLGKSDYFLVEAFSET